MRTTVLAAALTATALTVLIPSTLIPPALAQGRAEPPALAQGRAEPSAPAQGRAEPPTVAQDRAEPPAPAQDWALPAANTPSDVRLGACEAGRLCLWKKPDFAGARQTFELSTVDIESCTPLPKGGDAQSLANRTGRPVTTYQSAECQETGEFETYPGGGTWLPRSPYQVRAFKIWEN
ncbi:peptidase inhibitor family I36 protein [Streptomyces sp. cmx-18-6]|uniref:peptidase inhibitor family I36 protein n=1 Tax=Streptomyces sp. cmx-18-6 TaxID=2790930 RepID=UPI00398040D3